MPTSRSERLKKYLSIGICLYIAYAFIMYLQIGNSTDTRATVNVFPDSSNAKNYRLTGHVEKSVYFGSPVHLSSEYTVKSFDWPNGGYETFKECKLNNRVECVSTSGDSYLIEVRSFEAESYDPYELSDLFRR
jgi:hypothetical protein